MIGKIKRVGLREVWRHEAHDFTTWLEENIDVLNESLDLTLMSADREQGAGDFSVDLVAEDSDGNIVIIENQFGRSDHDHLGKLITYVTVLEARLAVWIVTEPRAEHVKAIAWLNESSTASFYLVKLEAIQIGDSPAAPLLTLITGPSVEAIKAGDTKKELAAREKARIRFWSALLDRAQEKTHLHSNISPNHHSWVGTSAGLPSGVNLNYYVRKNDARVGLYIDCGADSGERNKEMFEQLKQNKDHIEEEFGEPLEWDNTEGVRACQVKKKVMKGGWMDEESWPEAHEAMIDAMIRLHKSLQPYLDKLEVHRR